jgi:hypothetical protein
LGQSIGFYRPPRRRGSRVLFSGCKIRRENLWLVYLQPTTNHQPQVLPPYFAARKKYTERKSIKLEVWYKCKFESYLMQISANVLYLTGFWYRTCCTLPELVAPSRFPFAYRPSMEHGEPTAKGSTTTPLQLHCFWLLVLCYI